MREKLLEIVLKTIDDFNVAYQQKIPLEKGEKTPLYGKEGVIDSLGLVSLIVMIEQTIEDNFEVTLILADERAMSQRTSPFLNVRLLVDYIKSLMDEELSVWTDRSL